MQTDTLERLGAAQTLYIYGAGGAGKTLLHLLKKNAIKISGFLDSNAARDGNVVEGVVVQHVKNVNLTGSVVIVASMFYREIVKSFQTELSNAKELLFYFNYIEHEEHFFLAKEELTKADTLLSRLADDESRQILNSLLSYRATLNKFFLDSIVSAPQYFCTLPAAVDYSIFYDVGAFTGDTLESMKQQYIFPRQVICFEPDPKNFGVLSTHAADQNVELHKLAVGSQNGVIQFASTSLGYSSKVSNAGSECVNQVTLDTFCQGQAPLPTYLKIDVEGSDLDVLVGATDVLSRCRPTIAVSIYHLPEHLYTIPLWIIDNLTDYSVYIRHHRDSIYETICYAIPNENVKK
ncbi:FkbM family methyltransferase [Alteromonas ponticola]|uniref:FkbM family methyltransferase n=2 Tax=Alteromonas aquimaris TaxID=2998417 RepID=A0ABT3P9D3_9ALTE|nr:FkbM family methyltransferase [Alteromonas aquimaris]